MYKALNFVQTSTIKIQNQFEKSVLESQKILRTNYEEHVLFVSNQIYY
jgi:hypothetical protein